VAAAARGGTPAAGSPAQGAHPGIVRREPTELWESADSSGSPRGARRTRGPEARHPVDAGGGLESAPPHALRLHDGQRSRFTRRGQLLNREFTAEGPNQRWVGDTTEFKIGESGKLYLAAILDLFSRFVVGWAVSAVNDRHLTLAALTAALNRRCPVIGLLHHSDRGSTYASEDYQDRLTAHGITCSMSRTGDCYDNAVMEAFFSTLKTELADRFDSHGQAKRELFAYIEAFYNTRRRHSTLDYVSPAEFERRFRSADSTERCA
jgi:transposase InsO family protein